MSAGGATSSPPSDRFAASFSSFAYNTNVKLQSARKQSQPRDPPLHTFVYTGNVLNVTVLPQFVESEVGEAGAAYLVWAAGDACRERGYK
jgi:hypothetical protein